MTRNQARKMAVEFVIDCLGDAEADGYQQHETTDWYEQSPSCLESTDNGFVVMIGEHRIRFTASVETNR